MKLLGEEASPSLLAILTTVPFGLSALFVWLNARHSRITGVLPCASRCAVSLRASMPAWVWSNTEHHVSMHLLQAAPAAQHMTMLRVQH